MANSEGNYSNGYKARIEYLEKQVDCLRKDLQSNIGDIRKLIEEKLAKMIPPYYFWVSLVMGSVLGSMGTVIVVLLKA